MCIPLLAPIGAALGASATSAAAVGTAATVGLVGTGISAYGAYSQGQSEKNMYNYQADVATQQQTLATRAADANVNAVQYNASQESKALAQKQSKIAGAQAATMAANGVQGATLADVQLDTFDTGKLDQMAVQYNADLKSWGIKNQLAGEIWGLDAEKTQYKLAGRNAAKAGNLNAVSSLLSGASQTINTALKYK